MPFRWGSLSAAQQAALDYIAATPAIRDVLLTGGDPLTMKTRVLRRYIEPLLDPSLESVRTIRLGTKSPAY